MLYFAYGSNLWREQMCRRCPEHLLLGSGSLAGYRWIITSRGYASIVASPADLVLGLVYQLSAADEQNLDSYEGVHQGCYYKKQVSVLLEGITTQCMTYLDPVTGEGVPRQEYIRRINCGIADAGLDPAYIERYLRLFVPESLP